MARNRPNDLRDLRDALARIRTLPGLTERAPGVFWLRRTPFMHFHTTRPPRRVNAKNGRGWIADIVLMDWSTISQPSEFVLEIRARYDACVASQEISQTR